MPRLMDCLILKQHLRFENSMPDLPHVDSLAHDFIPVNDVGFHKTYGLNGYFPLTTIRQGRSPETRLPIFI
jgi:hypothetical protein